eukprot:266443-Rhodomonas_salina.1
MSSDLIVHDDERCYFKAKPANSKQAESAFGFLDYQRKFCQYENIVRTNGRGYFRFNGTATWMKEQSP